MNFTIKGKLTEKFDTQQVSDKFKKREFVIETVEEKGSGQRFVENIKFQLVNNNCSAIDAVSVGQEVEVQFNIKGKRFEKEGKVSYFNNLDAWKVTGDAKPTSALPANTDFEKQSNSVTSTPEDDGNSNLPF